MQCSAIVPLCPYLIPSSIRVWWVAKEKMKNKSGSDLNSTSSSPYICNTKSLFLKKNFSTLTFTHPTTVEYQLSTDMASDGLLQDSEKVPGTNLEQWRLHVKDAVLSWRYLDESESLQHPQSTVEKYFLGLPTACSPAIRPQLRHRSNRNLLVSSRSHYWQSRSRTKTPSPMAIPFIKAFNSRVDNGAVDILAQHLVLAYSLPCTWPTSLYRKSGASSGSDSWQPMSTRTVVGDFTGGGRR